jgi:hypothetical protein
MNVDGSPAQAGEDAPIPSHRKADPVPQPGGTFVSAEQMPVPVETSDPHDQEQ